MRAQRVMQERNALDDQLNAIGRIERDLDDQITMIELGDAATGGKYSAPIFRDFMQMALKDKPPTPFRVPPGIKLIRVSAGSGMRAGSGEGAGTILEAFKPGTAPPEYQAPVAGYGGGVPPEAERAVTVGTGGLY